MSITGSNYFSQSQNVTNTDEGIAAYETIENEILVIHSDIDELALLVAANETNIDTNQTQIGTIQTTVDGHTTQIGTLQTTTSGHTGQISTLQTTSSSHTTSIFNLQYADTVHDGQIAVLQSTDSTQAGQITTLQGTTATHSGQISTLQSTDVTLLATTANHTSLLSGITRPSGNIQTSNRLAVQDAIDTGGSDPQLRVKNTVNTADNGREMLVLVGANAGSYNSLTQQGDVAFITSSPSIGINADQGFVFGGWSAGHYGMRVAASWDGVSKLYTGSFEVHAPIIAKNGITFNDTTVQTTAYDSAVITAIQAVNATQTSDITAIQAVNTTQTADIAAIQTKTNPWTVSGSTLTSSSDLVCPTLTATHVVTTNLTLNGVAISAIPRIARVSFGASAGTYSLSNRVGFEATITKLAVGQVRLFITPHAQLTSTSFVVSAVGSYNNAINSGSIMLIGMCNKASYVTGGDVGYSFDLFMTKTSNTTTFFDPIVANCVDVTVMF